MKVLISGGGTGGHVFPAIAIADAVKRLLPDTDFYFVGALGRLEMTKIPEAGYRIVGLPIRGLQRRFSLENIKLIWYVIKSLAMSYKIIKSFKPDVVVGVGGYASGPVLRVASWLNIPMLLQEQNSYPGITNRILSKSAKKICVAFDGLEKYFEKSKLLMVGNPVRDILKIHQDKVLAREYFKLDPDKKTLGIFGGSLGAKSLNEAVKKLLPILEQKDVQCLWQTGKTYYEGISKHPIANMSNVKKFAFIDRMDLAYAACDLVVSRAGALTLAELCVTGKPAVLVPSPNVAEDHQRKNAKALVKQNAAKMILDNDLDDKLYEVVNNLINNEDQLELMKAELIKLAKPDAAKDIATAIIEIGKK